MKLYLDDDTVDRRLFQQLERAGHTVWIPTQVGLSGVSDARHMIHCCQNDLVLITRNYDDFLDLHLVIEAAGGVHPGILMIRMDNDPARDLTPRGVVTAISRFESSRFNNCRSVCGPEPLAIRHRSAGRNLSRARTLFCLPSFCLHKPAANLYTGARFGQKHLGGIQWQETSPGRNSRRHND